MPVPVALFTYKRPEHTVATLEALARNTLASQTSLHIFCDGSKGPYDAEAVAEVRRIARDIAGFASVRVIERQGNMGLANSIVTGVSELLDQHEKIIVLEDDLISSPHLLTYMNAALEHYRNDPRVFSVTGYIFPPEHMKIPADYQYDTFVGYRCASWSWGTWIDRWRRVRWDMDYFDSFAKNEAAQQEFDRGGQDMSLLLRLQYEKKIDSWAIRFCYAHHVNNMRCIYPVKSLIRNIGLDYSGTHGKPEMRYLIESLDPSWLPKIFCPTANDDPRIAANFRAVFDPTEEKVYASSSHDPLRIVRRVASRLWGLLSKLYRRVNFIAKRH